MKTNDEIILEVLQGNKVARWPTARLIKIFIASNKSDFIEERKQLLEIVGPELQSVYDDKQIEVEFVDVHFGSPESDSYNAYLFEDHLSEIKACYNTSRGCFFLCLIGNKYKPYVLPSTIESDIFDVITSSLINLEDVDLLSKWYSKDSQNSGKYTLKYSRDSTADEWRPISEKLTEIIFNASEKILSTDHPLSERLKDFLYSSLEKQFRCALDISSDATNRIFAVFRNWETSSTEANEKLESDYFDIVNDNNEKCQKSEKSMCKFRKFVCASLPDQNYINLNVPWKSGGIDSDHDEHESYLNKFQETVTEKIKNIINKTLTEDPELNSRKKLVQEVFQENVTHLSMCFEDTYSAKINTELLSKIKTHLLTNFESNSRHCPLIIHGKPGTGKTTLIKTIYRHCNDWLTSLKSDSDSPSSFRLFRFVRFAASTPRSAYNLELLRVICQQICIVLKLPDGFVPKDASFDPLYINNWFQNLLRRFEEMNNHVLIILIDDLHKFNPLDSDIFVALSWIPITLPKNVYIICTTAIAPDLLKLTPVQKERFRNTPDCYLDMESSEALHYLFDASKVETKFDDLEKEFTQPAVSRLATLITCSEYGLSETELLELVMPTSDSDVIILLEDANFNFSSFCSVRRKMGDFLCEKLMNGKLLIDWSHDSIRDIAKKRYLKDQELVRNTHAEIANLFFSEFGENEENGENEAPAEPALPPVIDIKDTPFQSTLHSDVTYSLRHVEESWIHLLKAGDSLKLKTLTVCNFDFLLAAVQTVSVSYLRCILEHVRCYLLDRDLELVYYTVRKSSDVLTRDPLQLGAQIISWLRPSADDQSPILSLLVTQAMAWCDGFTLPLLVPLTCWLNTPLAGCVGRGLQVTGIYDCVATPPGQHVVCVSEKRLPNADQPTLWHVMSKQLVHTFKGHSGPVLCMHITRQSQYLITGSEDISIIVWDLKTLTLKLRIYEHIAPVLTVASALNNSVIVSGGEDSSIIITSLADGHVVMKIDHHRGPVTSVRVNTAGDVLVSGSHDKTICLWSLENFTLLNTIVLTQPIKMIDISADSVFLLAACEDNNLYLRTLATGTELHSLVGHKGKVRSLCLAQDSCRAVVGSSDGRVYIYDMHSSHLIKTLPGPSQNAEVTCVRVTDKDDFLITAGGNKINFYPFRDTDAVKPLMSKLSKKSHQILQAHTAPVTCIDISRDNQLAVTGSTDNLVNVWQLNSQELIQTLEGHTCTVTCVACAPNGLFVVSGSEDRTCNVWGLTLGNVVACFKGHQAAISAVSVMLDSCRVVSADKDGLLTVWVADNGSLLQSLTGPSERLAVTNNMKYATCTNGDNTLRIWSLLREEEKYNVCHSEEITCFVLTLDSLQVITGSRDMSLKVWQLAGGKLSQVLVGHTDAVTCVAVSFLNKTLVVSGSCDTNCIVWDINTGSDLHTLSGHLAPVTCIKLSPDGTIAISGSEDKTIVVWDTKGGLQLTSLQLHIPIVNLEVTSDGARIAVHLKDARYVPIICLHNTPAKYVKLPTYVAPAKDIDARPVPKRQIRRLLKKEVSLDTYTWQKKYGHLTSNMVIAAMDDRLKRRFSVSASMEEISKIPQNKSLATQKEEQASLAQSQHFDQLEALWNKRSPPRRRLNQSLSKQSSLVESHLSSDEEDQMDQLSDLPGE